MVALKTTTTSSSPLTPVVWCILITETGERFAYYGFRAVLVLYFTQALHYTEAQSIALFAYTTALAYLSPVLGALLADGSWGRYYTIMVFGGIYVVGLVVLTIAAALVEVAEEDGGKDTNPQLPMKRWISMTGLLLVCLGTGGIKPCVSAFGADQITLGQTNDDRAGNNMEAEELLAGGKANDNATLPTGETLNTATTNEEHVRAFFAYFYFCINVGAVSSIAIIPILRGYFGFGMAFFVPTLFMMIAMGLFWSMRHHYIHHAPSNRLGALNTPANPSLATTFRLCWWLVRKRSWPYLPAWILRMVPSLRPGPRPVDRDQAIAVSTHDHDSNDGMDAECNNDSQNIIMDQQDQQLSDASQALGVLPIMSLLPIFWCLYDQQSSVWTLQATRMELNGLQPEQLNVVNPVQIMLFLPLFDKCIYPWMTLHEFNIRPLRRMSYGMVLAAVAFFVSGWVEAAIQRQEEAMASDSGSTIARVNVFWQLPQITLLSVAEICVSVTGLEFAYATSPDRLKAFLMALFLLTTAVGDFLSGFLYSTIFADLNRVWVMHICGLLMLGNLIMFIRVAQWWEREPIKRQGIGTLEIQASSAEKGIQLQERRIT